MALTTVNRLGTKPMGQSVAPQITISGLTAMAESFLIDPSLPTLGQDPFVPNDDFITIAKGRLVGVKNPQTSTLAAYAQEEKAFMTLANGSDGLFTGAVPADIAPIGYAEQNYFRTYSGQIQPFPVPIRGKLASIPYIQASNGAYGALVPGNKVTAYYGTTGSGAILGSEVGKIVKFVPKAIQSAHQAGAATTITLPQALFPAFRPTAIMAWNAGTLVPLTSATYSYVGNCWTATVNANITDLLYTYGQEVAMIAGEVISFQAVGNAGGQLDHLHNFPGWMQWVRDNYFAWVLPPEYTPHPYTTILNEVPTNIGVNQWRLAQFPVVPIRTISVYVTGSRIDPNTGLTTTLDGTAPLPLASQTFIADYTYGQDYSVNPITGVLTIYDNVTVSSLTVTYSANLAYIEGKIYDAGVQGLTDGRYSGVPGTPAHLEMLGVIADMHVALF